MSDTPRDSSNLLSKAVADRDARPWNYYRLEPDDLKRMLNQLADKLADAQSQIAALREDLAVAQTVAAEWREKLVAMIGERDQYKALASVGTWHKDCRPNRHMAAETIQKQQATIDKLADTISELQARLSEMESPHES